MLKKQIESIVEKLSPWKKGVLFFLILLAAYIQFLNPYITCDHIGQALFRTEAAFGWKEIENAFSGGRYGNIFLSFCYFILGKFNISHYENIYVIQIMGILLYAVCCVILYDLFAAFFEDEKQKKLLYAIILLCFINPFMVETYVYGSFDWAFGILLAVIAAKWIFRKKYIKGFIMAFLAVSVYQTNIFIVAIVAFLACFIKNINLEKKRLYLDSLIVCLLSGGAAMLNILILKVFSAVGNDINPGKTPQVSQSYVELIIDILKQVKSIYVGMIGTYPVRFFALFVIIMCAGVIIFLLWKKQYCQMVLWTIAVGILFLLPFAYMLASNSAWCTQRTLLPVFFAMAMFLTGTMFWFRNHQYMYKVFGIACAVFLGITLYSTETMIMDCYIGQALDYSEVICIEDEIREYEEATGIVVDTISWKKTEGMEYEHQLLTFQYGNLCSHRIICDAGDYLLDLVSEKDYTLLWMTEEEFEMYFEDKDWTVFNPSEQLHFEGNVLYWAVY
ncbi:MAG: glucosyltransferase domain-containing protein [Lachnospiraceae bacterium]|nr:glucosyltransferase domain-containing protein [Lachnospiraceae bacterium]